MIARVPDPSGNPAGGSAVRDRLLLAGMLALVTALVAAALFGAVPRWCTDGGSDSLCRLTPPTYGAGAGVVTFVVMLPAWLWALGDPRPLRRIVVGLGSAVAVAVVIAATVVAVDHRNADQTRRAQGPAVTDTTAQLREIRAVMNAASLRGHTIYWLGTRFAGKYVTLGTPPRLRNGVLLGISYARGPRDPSDSGMQISTMPGPRPAETDLNPDWQITLRAPTGEYVLVESYGIPRSPQLEQQIRANLRPFK